MSLRDKIEEACYYDALCGGLKRDTIKFINIGRPTLDKYVLIGTHMNFSLLEKLNEKGPGKITLGFANLLVKKVINTEHQLKIYDSLKGLSNKERIIRIDEETECPICCENKSSHDFFQCCESYVCCDCVYKHLDISINSIAFEGCKCPMCSTYLSYATMEEILCIRSGKNPERSKWIMRSMVHTDRKSFVETRITRYKRLHEKWSVMLRSIKNYNLKEKIIVKEDVRIPQKRIMKSGLYYGICNFCCPPVHHPGFVDEKYTSMNVKVKTIEKSCVNGEGNIAVLNNDMFRCDKCSVKEKEDNIFKKCPHCGVKTLKPDECKYVICGDHRWCWICNERLPNNHEGHNVHYWMGPGSSPYADSCRRSSNYNADDFVLNTCDCPCCHIRGGAPLCREIDCMNGCMELYNDTRSGYELTCGVCS